MRKVTQGWQWFECEQCDHRWSEACRDYQTPSGSACPGCSMDVRPYYGVEDLSIPVDESGNLKGSQS